MQHNLKILNSAKYHTIISPLLRERVKHTFKDVVCQVGGIIFFPFILNFLFIENKLRLMRLSSLPFTVMTLDFFPQEGLKLVLLDHKRLEMDKRGLKHVVLDQNRLFFCQKMLQIIPPPIPPPPFTNKFLVKQKFWIRGYPQPSLPFADHICIAVCDCLL